MDINYKANISNEIENNVVINDQEIEIKDEQFKYDKGNTVEKEKKRKRKKALKLYLLKTSLYKPKEHSLRFLQFCCGEFFRLKLRQRFFQSCCFLQ